MNKEAKELIQEGLKLFSSYNRDTLKNVLSFGKRKRSGFITSG